MGLVLLIIVLVLIFGGPLGGYSGYWPNHYGYAGGGLGLILLIVVILLLFR